MDFAATDERLYLCSVIVIAAWLEMVQVLAHNQVDAGSSPAAATATCVCFFLLDFNWF